MRGTFAAFGDAYHYRLLWGGTLFSTTAFMTSFLLVPIVAYEITGSYTASGLALMGSGCSMLLLGPIGGVIADRYSKKPLVLLGQIVPALLMLGTGVLVVTDVITLWMLFLSSLLMGVGFALMGPARQGLDERSDSALVDGQRGRLDAGVAESGARAGSDAGFGPADRVRGWLGTDLLPDRRLFVGRAADDDDAAQCRSDQRRARGAAWLGSWDRDSAISGRVRACGCCGRSGW